MFLAFFKREIIQECVSSFSEPYDMLWTAFGDVLSKAQTHKWFSRFKDE